MVDFPIYSVYHKLHRLGLFPFRSAVLWEISFGSSFFPFKGTWGLFHFPGVRLQLLDTPYYLLLGSWVGPFGIFPRLFHWVPLGTRVPNERVFTGKVSKLTCPFLRAFFLKFLKGLSNQFLTPWEVILFLTFLFTLNLFFTLF